MHTLVDIIFVSFSSGAAVLSVPVDAAVVVSDARGHGHLHTFPPAKPRARGHQPSQAASNDHSWSRGSRPAHVRLVHENLVLFEIVMFTMYVNHYVNDIVFLWLLLLLPVVVVRIDILTVGRERGAPFSHVCV